MSAGGFDAESLGRSYAFLDACPERFLSTIVTLPVGSLEERVRGVRAWRDALLDGRMPASDTWPRERAEPARRALAALDVVRFGRGQPELVDDLLEDVLASIARCDAKLRDDIAERLRALEALERAQRAKAHAEARRRKLSVPEAAPIDEAMRERLRRRATQDVLRASAIADGELMGTWGERVRAWACISEVFGDLGALLGRGWDLSQGVLQQTGWKDLLRLRELVAKLPQLGEIIRSLGRLQVSDTEESVADTIFAPVRRLEEERREVRTSHVPAETRGVERSGEIARMLPVEAMNLGHPKLRLVWHARRMERALLTYRVEGVEVERAWVERDSEEAVQARAPRSVRGPIIAIVDTSGSMHGLPERVAKALVLEALRTAHAERRPCFLYAYSGPGQVEEHELALTPDGIGRLLAFLGRSFGGGNDEAGMLGGVLDRLEQTRWKKADVVFVSDGEWPDPTKLLSRVERAKEAGTRFHGVQIGNRGRTGLHSVCAPVHVFRDWVALGA